MAIHALTGTRLRERRIALGVRQVDLAQRTGISPAYLNLIEHNRRRVAPGLALRLAEAMGLPAAALSELAGSELLEELRVASAVVGLQGEVVAETDRMEEFAGRYPGWAATVAALGRRVAGLERAVEALNDRMSHDPHLSAALHEVLSAISSVRSTAAILAETEDIEPDWRLRFQRNLHEDSERLAIGAEALVAYLDGAGGEGDEQGTVAPQEELENWLTGKGWHLAALEPGEGSGPSTLELELEGMVSRAARALARDWITRAAEDARAMPLAPFARAIEATGGDPVRVAQMFGVGILSVLRRIALRPGAVEGLVTCDASGALVIRKPASGFVLPRFASACPLWPLFSALARPGSVIATEAETVGGGGGRYSLLASAELTLAGGMGGVELREAAMLIRPADLRHRAAGPLLRLGSTCRVCPRADCPARREPPIVTGERPEDDV